MNTTTTPSAIDFLLAEDDDEESHGQEIEITISFRVTDEAAFRQAAYDRAITDELGQEEASQYLDSEAMSVTQCAVMVFDPSLSPPGTSIHDSSAHIV